MATELGDGWARDCSNKLNKEILGERKMRKERSRPTQLTIDEDLDRCLLNLTGQVNGICYQTSDSSCSFSLVKFLLPNTNMH